MNKKEAIEKFVQRDFSPVPQEWVKIVMESKNQPAPLPMWGTMWIVNFGIWGEKLWKNSSPMDENVDGFDEEMEGQNYINGIPSVYIYEIDDQYVIGVNGAGWNFYDGVWDKLYDFFGLEWHEEKQEKCSICGDDIYGLVQVHHHNEKCKNCGYEMIATQPHNCEKKGGQE